MISFRLEEIIRKDIPFEKREYFIENFTFLTIVSLLSKERTDRYLAIKTLNEIISSSFSFPGFNLISGYGDENNNLILEVGFGRGFNARIIVCENKERERVYPFRLFDFYVN